MLLTITTTHRPATDLGYLLHKNPARAQRFPLSFGSAHVFYPEAADDRCTAALLLDVDPIGLVRNRRGPSGDGGRLDHGLLTMMRMLPITRWLLNRDRAFNVVGLFLCYR